MSGFSPERVTFFDFDHLFKKSHYMTDQAIVELIRTDQSDRALNALYKDFPMIQKLIRSKGGDKKDAEDLFQEALIILIRKIRGSDFKLTAHLSTYLYSVCRFLWKDQLKKQSREVPYDLHTGLTEPEELELYTIVEEEERVKLAEKVLGELKDRCRDLLLLFYEGRLKLKDIAARMGYNSENTAKNQKYKCLEVAKNRLKELKQTLSTF
jgi:RNA polymerase sigma factor (sigma-70 family)